MRDFQSHKYHNQNHILIPHHLLHMAQTSSTESSDQQHISDRETQSINDIRNQFIAQDKQLGGTIRMLT